MGVSDTMKEKLTRALQPDQVEIIDDSARHAGHAGARPGGESHFKVIVVANAFEGASRVARQRMVYEALADELAGGVHALELKTLTPGEAHAK